MSIIVIVVCGFSRSVRLLEVLPKAGPSLVCVFHRLAPQVTSMQPLSALQRLTAVTFTRCDYGAGKELPTRALAALTGLVALDASECDPFHAAGRQPCGAKACAELRLRLTAAGSQHNTPSKRLLVANVPPHNTLHCCTAQASSICQPCRGWRCWRCPVTRRIH